MHLQSIAQIITGLQLMFFWVGESIIEAGELGEMVPLGPANFAVRRALIWSLVVVVRGKGVFDQINRSST